jgi:hypothetical protein
MYVTISSVKAPIQNERLLSTFHDENTQIEQMDGHSFQNIVQNIYNKNK